MFQRGVQVGGICPAGLAAQMREVQERGERVIRRDVLAQKHGLSRRQRAALDHALEHGELTIQGFGRLCPKVSRRTLQRELRAMVEKGLLIPAGATNRLNYRLGKAALKLATNLRQN